MKDVAITSVVIVSAALALVIGINLMFFNPRPWEPENPVVVEAGVVAAGLAMCLGVVIGRRRRVLSWIVFGSGVLFFLMGLLTPQF
jgi:hypothetical protein